MKYVLVLKNNSVMVFCTKSCAELYAALYGGTITASEM